MNRPAAKMTLRNMQFATEMASRRVQGWLDLARRVEADERKTERLAQHECRACFYPQSMAGSAMTSQPCMSCGADEMYSSTNTDVLCLPCATAGSLCKHCGGDLEMRVARREWPTAYSDQPNPI